MKPIEKKVSALGLCSGGLDSILAGLVLRRQAVEVHWITFETPFFSATKARQAAQMTGIPLIVKPITPTYLKMLKNPNCGYGKYMNPCLDCHALMFQLAGEVMEANGHDFLFSGEVLGQRPMSQTKSSLRYVEKNSGYAGYILRPLSAQLLPPTIPEEKGWIHREKLLNLSGRGRKRQIKLAKKWGVTDYPAPAGGCLLTDKGYSKRLKDLFDHQETIRENELELLKYGRHFRIDDQTKIIVGRTEKDNDNILKYSNPEKDTIIRMRSIPGPVALIPGGSARDKSMLAATMCAGYSKASDKTAAEIVIRNPSGKQTLKILGVPPKKFNHLLI